MFSESRQYRTRSLIAGYAILLIGLVSLLISMNYDQAIMAFIGLGLIFWGLIFVLLKPTRFVEGSLLEGTVLSTYATLDRIIKDLNCKGKSYYIPPYPKDVYLPDHLGGLKDLVVFISADEEIKRPLVDDIAGGRFLLGNSRGVLISPPGLGLLNQLERKVRGDFASMELDEIRGVLIHYIAENFNLVKSLRIDLAENKVNLTVGGSLYAKLYEQENEFKSVAALGCPVVSLIACALAKASGKLITIQKQTLSDFSELEVELLLLEA